MAIPSMIFIPLLAGSAVGALRPTLMITDIPVTLPIHGLRLSNDPSSVDQLHDIEGLYIDPLAVPNLADLVRCHA